MSGLARRLFYTLPPGLRFAVRWLAFLPHDLYGQFFLSGKDIQPPRRLIYTGAGDFTNIGKAFVEDFKSKNLVHPGSFILDVGSGIGRLAIPFTTFLTTGKYEGFDIMKAGIDWCRKNISSRHPNFTFTYVPLSNDLYRNEGGDASRFVFPYPEAHFDFVILTSVFTHMVPEEVQHYLSEIHRVLKQGGHVYATFFILSENARANMKIGLSDFEFKYDKGHYSLMDEQVKSANVAFDETYLFSTLIQARDFFVVSVENGSWSDLSSNDPIGFQDRVVLRKI